MTLIVLENANLNATSDMFIEMDHVFISPIAGKLVIGAIVRQLAARERRPGVSGVRRTTQILPLLMTNTAPELNRLHPTSAMMAPVPPPTNGKK
jgi:hypothetical protein